MGRVVLWLALTVVAVGWPVLALLADRRGARRAATTEDDGAYRRRVGLSAGAWGAVLTAVRAGTAVKDPRLRPSMVERAERTLTTYRRLVQLLRRAIVLNSPGAR